MNPPPVTNITQVLTAIEQGDGKSTDEQLPLVYHELRRMAAHKMAVESAGHTLQPTALVHEAWLKLVEFEQAEAEMKSAAPKPLG